ncbi:Dabb family protein [Microbacterium sp.]|uniref:Dabb family protein n=1 Tax=Microbacterium sp. TaxID=51671 RepID=UPI003A905BE4
MLRHVVMWRLAATDPAVRAAQAREIADRLTALVGVVPAIAALSAGPNTGSNEVDGNWDAALVVDVADRDALAAYANHPAHQDVVAYVRGVAADRVAVDFEV